MSRPVRYWAVVPAAGSGSRMQSEIPKQYLNLNERAVLSHTLARLLGCALIEAVVVALSPADNYWPTIAESTDKRILTVVGGDSRAESVLCALRALKDVAHKDDYVLVHDAARPCLREQDLHKLIDACSHTDVIGGLLAVPVHDTMKRSNPGGLIEATVPRENLWHAQTPQCFPLGLLQNAIEQGIEKAVELTDEASSLEAQGLAPLLVEGRSDNIKITRPADLQLAELYLSLQSNEVS